jgi:hypothetical protein
MLKGQNFFTKTALAVISSRVTLPPAFNKNGELKQNKWACSPPLTPHDAS